MFQEILHWRCHFTIPAEDVDSLPGADYYYPRVLRFSGETDPVRVGYYIFKTLAKKQTPADDYI